ncbi:spermidine/putrescine ABC transporter substrate-binding protein [Streptomyces sp. HNM0574]|uniref:polyamine ABC transporter substrate-binding protein n=1 Tax=Streptomyces sp. HNM0574 TaxID=2714954 RepID=UPI00146F7185|nr:spermidine/putrescine ABC transporter substrate-binding protein [Streptomyces sp. HNM0574]NLU69719.1 spermidine/putrescine ABC transporter substrate-binding protein [Streptomyces sp. HNM0574]
MDLYDGMPEPVRAAWERSLTHGRAAMSRRRLLRAASLAAGGGLLAGCGIPPAAGNRGGEGPEAAPDHSKKERVLNFANWPLYIDVDDKNKSKRPTLDRFERRSGVKVKYVEDVNDNNEFYGKIKPQLAAGQDTGRDLVCLSDWMAGRVIRQGWAQRLDPANLPHAVTNLEDRFRTAAHDPGRQFSYPWAGTACIVAYNKKATKGKDVTSVRQLLEDDSLKGRVSMLTEMTDTMGLTMLDMGVNPERFTADDFDAALARIQKAVDSKQLRRFSGNDYLDELSSGDIAACLAWAGDIVQLKLDNPDIGFALPESGYLFGTDDLLVPAKARHQDNAEALIDHYYRPKEAAELAAWINYICPVTGAKAEMEKIDKDLAEDPLVFPDEKTVSRGKNFRPMDEKEETGFQQKFATLIGS